MSDAVDALKAQRPADPAKPPAPGETPDPAKPAEGQVLSLRAPFIVKDAAGRVIFKVDVAGGSQPRAIVGNPAGGRVEIGIGAGGASVVGLYDDSGKILSTLVGDPNGSYLRLRDNDQSAALGKVEGTGTGLYLRKAEKSFAELVVGKTGHGVLKVFNADGKAVSGMFASAEGGGVSLTGPTGRQERARPVGHRQRRQGAGVPGGGRFGSRGAHRRRQRRRAEHLRQRRREYP